MALTKVAPAGIGSTPGDGYRIGSSFLHSTGVELTNANASGIVTAAQFDGKLNIGIATFTDDVKFTGATSGRDLLWDKSENELFVSDNARISFGNVSGTGDFEIAHDSNNTVLQNRTGGLYLKGLAGGGNAIYMQPKNNESSATFHPDGAVDLFYNNVKRLETSGIGATITGQLDVGNVNSTGVITATKFVGDIAVGSSITYADNEKAYFGTDLDLQIYHSGTHGFISNSTNDLKIDSDNIKIRQSNSSAFIKCENTAVKLHFNDNEKLATTNTGVTVTGALTATTFVGALTGAASQVTATANNDNTAYRVPFTSAATGSASIYTDTNNGMTYNPSSGTLSATTFSGDGSNLTGITGTTINNNANNRIITGSGTANTLEGESNFTYDGNEVAIYAQTDDTDAILHLVGKTASGGVGQAGRTAIIAESTHNSNGRSSMHLRTRNTSNAQLIAMTIDGDQNVGIGTQLPNDIDSIGRALNIASATGGAIYLQDTDAPTTKFAAISYNGVSAALQIHAHHSASTISLGTDGTERLHIDSSGNVKVTSRGSNVSGAPFYVAVTGKSSITYGGGNDDTACLRIVDNGSNNSYYHGIELRSKRDGDARIYAHDKGSDSCDLVFATDNSGLTEKMRITSGGNIGIGNRTSNPDQNLHVHTASGDCVLHVEAAADPKLRLRAHNGQSLIQFADSASSTAGEIVYDHATDELRFRVNSTSDRLKFTSNFRLEMLSDEGIFIKSSGDNAGAKIRFSTNPAGGSPYNQIGHIIYYHGDNSIVSGYGEGMVMGGTESNGFILRLDGALNIKDSDSAGGDGAKLLFGTDKDMRIYHSGGDGFFDLTGTGGMRFRVNDLVFSNYNTSGTRRVRFHGDEGIQIYTVTNAAGGSSGGAVIAMSDASDFSQVGKIRYVHSDNSVVNDGTSECFVMEGSETQTAFKLDGRFYISDSKFVLKPTFSDFDNIPNGSNSGNSVGCMMKYNNEANGNSGVMSNSSVEPFIANRSGSDGIIMRIRHQGNTEGQITVSGGTVSYQNFMGAHKAQLVDHSKPDLLIGTVMEAVDQLATWKYASFSVGVGTDATTKYIPYYGSKNDGETDTITYDSNTYSATIKDHRDSMPEITKHVCVKVSDTVGSKAVFGVFNSWEEDNVVERESGNAEYSWNDLQVAAIGNYYIRMQSGQTPEVGDYVESAGDGTAKVQSDDILRSKTIAKITSTTKQKTYSDGSFLITCTLHCG